MWLVYCTGVLLFFSVIQGTVISFSDLVRVWKFRWGISRCCCIPEHSLTTIATYSVQIWFSLCADGRYDNHPGYLVDCFQTHWTIFRHPAQQRHMRLLIGGEFRWGGGEYVVVRKRNLTTTVSPQPGLQYRCHCTSTCRMNNLRLILTPSVICYPYYKCCALSENKMPG